MPQRPGNVDRFDAIAPALLAWYDVHARDLPWRSKRGEAADPYRVWLSEIMLQQTTVAAVRSYFERFTKRWPDVASLAAAEDGELMAAWAGLGYYARARNLLACARMVMRDHGGEFPGDEAGLRALPGIGAYTAAAIAAIAFGQRAVVVDANVERVVARLFAIVDPLPGGKAAIREHMDRITPDRRAGDFAQAMMDLGAKICTPRRPACALCPLILSCEGRPDADRYPVKPAKAVRPRRKGTAWWIVSDGHVLLERRPSRGMLGGMLALPSDNWSVREGQALAPPVPADWTHAGTIEHVFTHFALDLDIFTGIAADRSAAGEWWPIDRLADAGLPTLFAKAALIAQGTLRV